MFAIPKAAKANQLVQGGKASVHIFPYQQGFPGLAFTGKKKPY